MSDFPDLGSEFATAPSSAAGTASDIDFDRAASAFPDISLDGDDFSTFSASTVLGGGGGGAGAGGFSFDNFDAERRGEEVKVTGNDEIEKFEDQFPELDVPQQPISQPTKPSFGAAPPFAPRPQPSSYTSTPIFTQPLEEDEPQVIKDWRDNQTTLLASLDARSAQKRSTTITTANTAIDNFYEDYALRKSRAIAANKDAEATYLEQLSGGLTQGTTWERICALVELENSQSKTVARTGPGTSDLGRFKEVLLRLKREGAGAPGAGGY